MQAHLLINELAGKRLHMGVTGSVAAYKALELLRMWRKCSLHVSATLTEAAEEFVRPLTFSSLGAQPVYRQMFRQAGQGGEESVFEHLEPGQAAQAMVIAPASADFIAKLANGLADDMLSCQALSFPNPLVVAPAMNPRLWNAQATRENWGKLKERGHILIEPDCGEVACGEEGCGRLPGLEQIYATVLKALSPQDLAGKKIMVTLGPTREQWDSIRFWSNPSSGIMGAAMALTAWLRGAQVFVVAGPLDNNPWLPPAIKRADVASAEEMRGACLELWADMDIGCFAAAVADFKPVLFGVQKFKKNTAPHGFDLKFMPNPDILDELAHAETAGRTRRVMAFAAETELDRQALKNKLLRKNADLLAANNIAKEGSGFGVATNEMLVMDKNGREESWPLMRKTEVAWRLWDWLGQI